MNFKQNGPTWRYASLVSLRSSAVYFYRPQRSCGQGYVFTPLEQTPPPEQTLPEQTPPRSRPPPRSRHQPPWSRHPPEQNTPRADTPLGADTSLPEQTPPWEQTPPPEADTPRSRHPLESRHAPGADTPREQTPPLPRFQHTVNERPVRILLECILVHILIFILSIKIHLNKEDMTEFGIDI